MYLRKTFVVFGEVDFLPYPCGVFDPLPSKNQRVLHFDHVLANGVLDYPFHDEVSVGQRPTIFPPFNVLWQILVRVPVLGPLHATNFKHFMVSLWLKKYFIQSCIADQN